MIGPCENAAGGRLASALLALLLCGCGSGDSPPGEPAGSGTISGSVDGRDFSEVAAAYIIGAPDDPANTAVIYLFDALVACGEITSPGWDESVPDQSQIIEIKLIGSAPGDYPVSGRPAGGECSASYTLASATPSEIAATAGSVSITAIDATAAASGSFDLTVPGGSLSGSFAAAGCAGGREP